MHEPQGTVIGASRLLLCDLQPIRAPQLSIHPQQAAESEGGERGVEGRERGENMGFYEWKHGGEDAGDGEAQIGTVPYCLISWCPPSSLSVFILIMHLVIFR